MLSKIELLTGFEGTAIHGTGKDVYELSRHKYQYKQDFQTVKDAGIKQVRVCIPWHKIESKESGYNWIWVDRYLAFIKETGLTPIADPLHHTSFPQWLKGGFLNEKFADKYQAFVEAFAKRYPFVYKYTIINEPFVTAWFCGGCGIWYPYLSHPKYFVPMIKNICEVILRISASLTKISPDIHFLHADTCERHYAANKDSENDVRFRNQLRFIVADLILGKVSHRHALHLYLTKYGFTSENLAWFREHAATIHTFGLDYYSHSEIMWDKKRRVKFHDKVSGLCNVAMDYISRYQLPYMIAETNLRGYISDRISWLRYVAMEYVKLQTKSQSKYQLEARGLCWYPWRDSTDWNSLVRKARGSIDPQGILWLDKKYRTHTSELSDIYTRLAKGEITPEDIPPYKFGKSVLMGRYIKNYLNHMSDWKWEIPALEKVV